MLQPVRPSVRTRTARLAVLTLVLVAGLVGVGPLRPAAAADDLWVPGGAGLELQGHGYGHGRGMSQWGSQGAALSGVGADQILSTYYPGTQLGSSAGAIRVRIEDAGTGGVRVAPRSGLELVDTGTWASWVLPGGPTSWRIVFDGAGTGRVESLTGGVWRHFPLPDGRQSLAGVGVFRAQGVVDLTHANGQTKAYRGEVWAQHTGGGRSAAVNLVGLEDYLRAVVPKESPASWRPAALQAQAVAARTYSSWHRARASGAWDICSTTACQVYGGVADEHPNTDAAIAATAGKVLTYNGTFAFTEFSASNGGWSTSGGVPYLPARQDPWDGIAPGSAHDWATTVSASALQSLGVGTVRRVQVLARDGSGEWGGRVTSVRVTGTSGAVTVTGDTFRTRLGLRSTWWTMTTSGILALWSSMGGPSGPVGDVASPELAVPGGVAQNFTAGRIYYSSATGAQWVRGAVQAKHSALGGTGGPLRFPVVGEQSTPARPGAWSDFQGGSVYWSPATGANAVWGSVRTAWGASGWENGPLGFPTTDETPTPTRPGAFNHFEGGSVYWSPSTGAHVVHGSIHVAWAASGWENGPLGFPTTDETPTPTRPGAFNHFERGSVYWSPSTGAHPVTGAIHAAWSSSGWENGRLGFPVDDAVRTGEGRVQHFEGGRIVESPDGSTARIELG